MKYEKIVDYIEETLRHVNVEDGGAFHGSPLKNPIAVVYVGEESAATHEMLYQNMIELWRPFKNAILFWGIRDDQTYFCFEEENGYSCMKDSGQDIIWEHIERVFGENTLFKDLSRTLVFYVMDTSDMQTEEEYRKRKALLEHAREEIGLENQLSVTLMLLNQDMRHDKDTRKILHAVGETCIQQTEESIYLISNRKENGQLSIENRYTRSGRIITNIIALCNGADPFLAAEMLEPRINAIGYAIYEKPFQEMSKVIALRLLSKLKEYRKEMAGDEREATIADLQKKLGFTEKGTIALLDEYCRTHLNDILPSFEVLELLPRKETKLMTADLKESEVNRLTMNTWEFYLETRIKEKINQEKEEAFEETLKKYCESLMTNLKLKDFSWIGRNMEQVKALFLATDHYEGQDRAVLEEAEQKICHKMSHLKEVAERFMHCVEEEVLKKQEFEGEWKKFIDQEQEIMMLPNSVNLEKMIHGIMQHYFDAKDKNNADGFKKINSKDELEVYITDRIREIFKSNPFFQADFKETLDTITQSVENTGTSRNLTFGQLLFEQLLNEEIYFYTSGMPGILNSTATSCVLMSEEIIRNNSLASEIKGKTYNTGNNTKVESMTLYSVPPSMLM